MQLKNSSPVAMEKRMDLASLFCMIGRHGPAVAVAVIAVVSVLAGFIIYRNVKGKRRKAAAGAADDDSKSPGKLTDAALLQPEESTDVSDEDLSVRADADVTLSLLKTRHRRAAAEKKPYSLPKKDFQPDEKLLWSLVEDSNSVQSNASTAENADVEDDVCQDVTDDAMNAVKEGADGDLEPAVICESHEEKVLKLEEDEKVITEDVLGQKMVPEGENLQSVLDSPACSEQISTRCQTQDGLEDKEIPPETNCMESYVEELISHTDADIREETRHPDHFDQLATLQQEIGFSLSKQTSLPSPQQDNGENVMDEMPSIQDGNGQQLEPESDPTTNQEGGVENDMLPCSCDEAHNLQSVVLGHDLPFLKQSVEPDLINDSLCDLTADAKDQIFRDPQPKHEVEDKMVPDFAKDATLDGLHPDVPELKNIQGENNEATTAEMPTEESVEHPVFSSIRDPDAAVCEKVGLTADLTSTETSHPEALLSFQDPKSDQMQNLDLPEVTSDPGMTESIKPPICQISSLSFDQIELTWSSAGTGEESGISSMTVSPALQEADIECDITPENVTDLLMTCCPGSEEQTGAQIQFFADDTAISVKDAAVAEPGSLLYALHEHDSEQTDGDTPSTGSKGMFGNEDVYHGVTRQSTVQVSELKKDVKAEDVESKNKDDEKTEISIMAATMDTNEWITDGNYQVLPWMNLSVPSLTQNTQTDQLSSKEHHSLVPVDAGNPPSTEVEQTILPYVTENAENDKKVVAVQPMPQNVNVTFRTHYLIQSPYQKVAITGNQQELGNWKEFIPLERTKDGHWDAVVSLPAESHVEWKFVVLDKGEVCRWEECGNRLLDTGYGDDLLVHKWWGLL